MDDELNIGEVALAIGEQLGQFNAVGVNMGIVNQGVVVAGIGTLPSQNHIVGVALVTEYGSSIGIHGGSVGDTQSAVGETGVDHGCAGVHSLGAVDFSQTTGGHFDGHNMSAVVSIGVLYGEVAVSFLPGGHKIGASLVGEELQNHIVLVVGQTGGQSIDEGVAGQIGTFGSDAGKSGDNLIVDHIASGSGAGVGKAIGNVSGGAAVLTGVCDLLTQSLFQGRNTGEVLGEQANVVNPTGAAVIGIGAVNGSHGDRYQEGVGSGHDHFGNCGFNDQIQTQLQIGCLGLTVGIGGSHLYAAVSSHVLFQSVLDGGGVGFQTGSQGIDQNIGLVEILGGVELVSVGITLCAVFQTQCLQKVSALHLVDAIQNFNMVVGAAISGGLGELDNVGDLHIAELHALDSIAVACFAIAQIGLVIGVTGTVAAQDINHTGLIHHAGGNIGAVPHAVLLGIGQIVLVDGQRTLAGLIDGSVCHLSCKYSGNAAQAQHQCQTQRDDLLKVFHKALSFLS